MKDEVILKVENLSKQYRLGLVGTGTLSHDLNRWWHRVRGKEDPYLKIGETNDRSTKGESEYVWALRDVNFEVKRGEVLGIIGKNGAGKSTLLKILSRVTSPTTGSIKTKGRIASLLEVGTGFHGEMTGRENIYLNGAILGMTKKEITAKIDEIIQFSGCERYIDTPVKRYSSGMTVRLAFAVAAFLEPDILIVDEVLAVGDAEFQKKAIGKIQDISSGEGRTVLFVSHNLPLIESICSRLVLMKNGYFSKIGPPNKILQAYKNTGIMRAKTKREVSNLGKEVFVNSVEFTNVKGQQTNSFNAGDVIHIKLLIKNDKKENLPFGLVWFIYDVNDVVTAVCHSSRMNDVYYQYESVIKIKIDSIGLVPGDYKMRVVLNIHGYDNLDEWMDCGRFTISKHDIYNLGFDFSTIWKTKTFLKSDWESEI